MRGRPAKLVRVFPIDTVCAGRATGVLSLAAETEAEGTFDETRTERRRCSARSEWADEWAVTRPPLRSSIDSSICTSGVSFRRLRGYFFANPTVVTVPRDRLRNHHGPTTSMVFSPLLDLKKSHGARRIATPAAVEGPSPGDPSL